MSCWSIRRRESNCYSYKLN